ncbi:hypothetical protein KAI52_02460, partial [Candidatus Parcubacteria bacterium]|nr:hypothetical protein [Candidatus Parcubacteria bacterium]
AGGAYGKITSTGDKIVSGSWAGIKTGADWLNRGQAKVTGQDLNLTRRWTETIKPAMERRKSEDMRGIYKQASELGKKRGLAGYALGSGSKDFYEQRVKGFLGLKGMKDAVATTFKTSEESGEEKDKSKKRIKALEHGRGKIISHNDFREKIAEINEKDFDARGSLDESTKIERDLTVEIDSLRRDINDPSYAGDKTKKELEKERNQKIEKRDDAKKEVEKDQNIVDEIDNERNKYNKLRRSGNLIDNDKAEKIKKTFDTKIEKEEKTAKKAEARQSKYILYDYEHQKDIRHEEYEEGSKLYSDSSDELVLMHQNAIAQGKEARAAAIMKRLAKNLDTNEILGAYGYNSKIGLTEAQYNNLKAQGKTAQIEQNKGLHDFMRDIMRDKLGMKERSVYALESEIGGLAKMNNEASFMDAVGIKNGKYVQNESAKQQEMAAVHIGKQDAETLARRGTRFAFGGEGTDGKFRVHESGLALMLNKHEIISKEIERERLNPWNALKLTEETNMKILRDGSRQLHGAQRDAYNKMLNNLEIYANKLRGSGGELEDRIKHSADTISQEWN